jgi:hypothetical protein
MNHRRPERIIDRSLFFWKKKKQKQATKVLQFFHNHICYRNHDHFHNDEVDAKYYTKE